jgi:NAD(P)H-hydrate epimerase
MTLPDLRLDNSLLHLPGRAASPLALLTSQQVRVADALAAQSGMSTDKLMGRAGAAIAIEVQKRYARRAVVVLVGPGNNGGDGLVAASELKLAGWPVAVALLTPPEKLKGDAAGALRRWEGPLGTINSICCDGAALVIDAIFGVGCDRDISPLLAGLFERLAERKTPVVAVDIPSGIEGNTGRLLGGAPMVQLTITFARRKPGHLLLPGRVHCGEVVVADIGIPAPVYDVIQPNLFENGPALWLEHFPWPQATDNKYTRGTALIAGGAKMTGAARLAARAAQRAGVGRVVVASPPAVADIYAIDLASCIIETVEGEPAWSHLVDTGRQNAILVGPGYGRSAAAQRSVLKALSSNKPCVLDADALSSFADSRKDLLAALQPHTVITPHDGEFARLFDFTGDNLRRASLAAVATGSIVLLKGAATVIAAPDGTCIINSNAPPGLATAGAGDVLAGIITGLLAQGMPPLQATAAGAWLQGSAASLFGPGLIAEDVVDYLPAALNALRPAN